MEATKYEAMIGDKWVLVSVEKLLFYLLPLGIVKAYRNTETNSEVYISRSMVPETQKEKN
jgi:hypothetical protein